VIARGGPQFIPRPEAAHSGGLAPWANIGAATLTVRSIEAAFTERGVGRVNGTHPTAEHQRSAVLVPLYEADGDAWVVLTRRSPNLRSHTHEVSFPGGRIDAGDKDEWAAALRESQEEIALDPALPRRIGELDSFITGGSQSFVTPIVAVLPGFPELTASEAEVERILHVRLSELLLPEVFREELWERDGQQRPITFFELRGDTVWGATGAMLRQLLAIATGTDSSLTG
jgi:8-oxo-dGTP pyrophosphatase MutT (NUDIX family)